MRIQDRPSFWRPAALAVLVLLPLAYWPFVALAWRALTPDGAAMRIPLEGVSGSAFNALWEDRALWATVRRAAVLTLASTALALIGGGLLGGLWARVQSPLTSIARTLLLLPLLLPAAAIAVVLRLLFDADGWAAALLRTLDLPAVAATRSTALLATTITLAGTGIVASLVAVAWERVEPGVTDAVRLLGGGPWSRFRRSAGHLVLPALVGGGALTAAIAWSASAGATLFDGARTDTLEVLLYQRASHDVGSGATAATLAAIALPHSIVVALLLACAYRATRTLRTVGRPAHSCASARRRTLVRGTAMLAILVVAGALVLATATASPAVVLTTFRTASVRTALLNSALITIDAATIAATIAMASVAALRRARTRARRFSAGLLLLPAAVTPLAYVLGVIAVTDGTPALHGTIWVVLAVHIMVGYPFALWGAFRRADPGMQDAARLSGARRWRDRAAARAIPGGRTFASSALLAATASLGEFAATALVRGSSLLTAPTLLADRWSSGSADIEWVSIGLALCWIGAAAGVGGLLLRPPSRTGT